MDRHELFDRNRIAWDSSSYAAWVRQYGTPLEAAEQIKADPAYKVDSIGHRNTFNVAIELESSRQ